jgi:hypothetical protein
MKDQQIESLELTLAQWQTEEPNSERGVRIIAEITAELNYIKNENKNNN